jgi:hypothetical protein
MILTKDGKRTKPAYEHTTRRMGDVLNYANVYTSAHFVCNFDHYVSW